MGDITKNFSYSEFKPKEAGAKWLPSQYQKLLLANLAYNLQIVRDCVSFVDGMKVTSGVRTMDDYNRLVKSGYHPSATSDHFCGAAVTIAPTDPKHAIFGDTYNFAVGAADIVPSGISAWELFTHTMRLFKDKRCEFGQVIYEKNPATKAEWVHFGNSPRKFFGEDVIKLLNRQMFMHSMDGGKTYTTIKG